jgi:vanillate O-demethylase monooxygenase subunit
MEPLEAGYQLLVDNLLDLSHETYLHGGYIGTPEVADTPITTEVDDEAGVVHVSGRMADAECPPFYARSTGLSGRITRWQDIEYRPPCLYQLHSRIAPVGVLPNADLSDPAAFHVEVVYAITPETGHSTHDFWAVARDFALDDAGVSEFLAEQNRIVVLQDVAALNVLQRVLDPVRDAGGTVVAAVSLVVRHGTATPHQLAALVRTSARAISRTLTAEG